MSKFLIGMFIKFGKSESLRKAALSLLKAMVAKTDNDVDDVLNNTILPVSRYQTFDNSNTIIFRAVESTQERETELLNYLSNKFLSLIHI